MLFVSQGGHRVEPGGSLRRQIAAEGGGGEQDCGDEESQRVAGFQSKEEVGGRAREHQGTSDAGCHADHEQKRRFLHNQAYDLRPAGAEGHANADLVAAADHHVGHNAVETDGRQKRGERAEEAGKGGHQPLANETFLNVCLKRAKLHAYLRVRLAEPAPDGGAKRAGGHRGTHVHNRRWPSRRILRGWRVAHRRIFPSEVEVLSIFDYTDDLILGLRIVGLGEVRKVLPMGSVFAKKRRTKVWLTSATLGDISVSSALKSRPASSGISSVSR